MKEPLVSVKMITYNHVPYIAQAIEGVLMQKTNFPFELVIGEDCSTDGTREIVSDYAKQYPEIIRVISSDENVGAKKNNLRTGEACRGKYIAFCEGDDYWHKKNKLQTQVIYLEKHPKCGLVCSDYDIDNTVTGKRIPNYIKHRNVIVPKSPCLLDFMNINSKLSIAILTCTVMARKQLIDKVKTEDPFLHHEGNFLMGDTQLWAELSNISDLHFMNKSLSTHRILAESAANSKDMRKKLIFAISSKKLYIYLCEKHNIPSNIIALHQAGLQHYSLDLAFLTMNSNLAEDIKKSSRNFTWKEWLKYYGSKNKTLNLSYRFCAFLFHAPRKKSLNWD